MSVKLVVIESPYAGDVDTNLRYLRAAMRDSILRGEAPFTSHAIYTQEGVLDDGNPDERKLGIDMGLEWASAADKIVVYMDLGISDGMEFSLKRHREKRRHIEYRSIPNWRNT